MYEIKITAETVGELKGRLLALVAEMSAGPVAVESGAAPVVVGEISGTATPVRPAEPKTEKKPAPKPKVEEPKVEEPKVEEPKVEEPKVEEAPAITYEQIRSAILKVSLSLGREGVNKILQAFGATKNAQEIDPSRYAEVLAMAEEMAG